MQQPNREIGALFLSSPFRFKTLPKFLKFVIHLFTLSKLEHDAGYCNGYVYNMSGKGGEMMKFEDWMKKYAINDAKVYFLGKKYSSDDEISQSLDYFKSCIGKPYSVRKAIQAIDFVQNITDFFRKQFGIKISKTNPDEKEGLCSNSTFAWLVYLKLFPPQEDILDPAELKSKLIKSPYFENQWRRLN